MKINVPLKLVFSFLLGIVLAASAALAAEAPKINVLILSGQNNHQWQATTPALQQTLEATGRFSVEVTEHPEACNAESLKKYDAVLSNWNNWGNAKVKDWPEAARRAFLDFVRNGKGFVVVHAGSSSFYDWPEYQQMAGASWKLGTTGHGPKHEFTVRVSDPDHPIVRGLREFATTDELWHRTGLQPDVKPLATAFSDAKARGTGNDEPVALVHAFGKGRTFILLLGHDANAMTTPGFKALLARGAEWAATDRVTLHVGEAMLGAAELEATLGQLKTWRPGQSRAAQLTLEQHIGAIGSDAAKRQSLAAQLAALIDDAQASPDAKQIACRELALTGSAAEARVLAKLLSDKDLAVAARFALERIGGEAAANALLAALKSGGVERAGLVSSLGRLHCVQATEELAALAGSGDAVLAGSAMIALGEMGTSDAADALLGAQPKPGVANLAVWNRAALNCAHALLAAGSVDRSCKLFELLVQPASPIWVRKAAFMGLVRCVPEKASSRLLSAARGDDEALRHAALNFLCERPQPSVLSALAKELPSMKPEAQVDVIPAVAALGVEARPAIRPLVDAKNDQVRLQAIAALGKAGVADDIAMLLTIAAGEDTECCSAARQSLTQMLGENVNAQLATSAKSLQGRQKAEALGALADRGASESIPVLLAALTDKDSAVQDQARRGLGELAGSEQVNDLVNQLRANPSEDLRRSIEMILASISRREAGNGAATAQLCSAIKGADTATRVSLAVVLGGVGGSKAEEVLQTALNDNEPEVRLAAVKSLSNWNDATPAEPLIAFAGKTDDARSRVLALRGVARLVTQARKLSPAESARILDLAITAAAGTDEQKSLTALRKRLVTGGPAPIADDLLKLFNSPANLALGAIATNPDGLANDGQGKPASAAVDGDPRTYWDEVDNQKLYQIRLQLKQRSTVSCLRILAYAQHSFAPKDFEVLCDDKLVKKVVKAEYSNALVTIDLPPTECQTVQLNITGCYPKSPAIRELGVFGKAASPRPAVTEPRKLKVERSATSLALLNHDSTVWRLHFDPSEGKPYFHPLALLDGTELTALRPPDHLWHRACWFSWKHINGLNYWEEDRKTGKSAGLTELVSTKADALEDGSANVQMELAYRPPNAEPILNEKRAIAVSAPDAAGNYLIDWSATFTALAGEVKLDRTPIPGQPGGVGHGGYAGFSVRASAALKGWTFTNSEGVSGQNDLHGKPARWMDFSGNTASGKGGLTIFDHPANPRHPTPWFVIQGMPYFSPALLFNEPMILKTGETLTLRYRLLVHANKFEKTALENEWQLFSKH